ncbi:MAG: YbgC/FadM family acyl-CoA thioesterase [Thermodesulfovibrionales bacterium]|nr:YbgC/FadM family acyl-CoA thioesterase [Thermodesulfovibrionales bacterium]
MNPLHTIQIKIYYEDTDAGGVVYYANYLRYMERARTEFLLEHGINVADYHRKGYLFAVVDVDIHYKRAARLGDLIDIKTAIEKMTNVTISIHHRVMRDTELLAEANVRLACIDLNGKPQKIPDSIRKLVHNE